MQKTIMRLRSAALPALFACVLSGLALLMLWRSGRARTAAPGRAGLMPVLFWQPSGAMR